MALAPEDARQMALTTAARMYAADAGPIEQALSLDIAKVVDEMHFGGIDIYAVDVDEDLFLIRFEEDARGGQVMTVEWRTML